MNPATNLFLLHLAILAKKSIRRRHSIFVLLGLAASGETAFAQRPLGTDVSHYQPTINWTTVKNNGIAFAWCKATQGTTFIDSSFTTHQANAKAAGVLIGAYHFPQYDVNLGLSGATNEANFFWSVAKNYIIPDGGRLMPMLDAENISSTIGPSQAGYTKTTFSQWVNAWCNTVSNKAAAAGITVNPVIYTGGSFGSTWLNSTVTNWTPWIANWPATPDPQTGSPSGTAPWSTWAVWQYADTNPYSGGDSDVFNGTTASLINTLVIGASLNSPPYFVSQPSSRYADRGAALTMETTAGGTATLRYQWRFNGGNISGATNRTLTLSNIQTTNGGNYTVLVSNSFGSVTSSIAALTVNALFTPVFSDNFDVNTSGSWTLNRSSSDTRATFAYDYSAIGVPSAPNSSNDSTKGLRLEANLSTSITNALNVSPVGQIFGGNYRLHFDMWINVNGPLPGGGTGSTESITAGMGTAGNHVQWNSAGSIADGVWFAVDGEGGVTDTSTTQGDFAAYIGATQQAVSSGVYSSGTGTSARGNADPYYANVFPGGQMPPAFQRTNYPQQTGSLAIGTVGFAWRDVIINKTGSTIEWFVDGLRIASVTGASITASNVFVGYWDAFASVSDNTNLSFGLVDNVRVEVPVMAPILSAQPQNLSIPQGANATFSVIASGMPAPNYQWRFNGTNILGATASSYTKTNAQLTDAGNYSVVVTNIGGSITSSNASLTIIIPPTFAAQPASRVINVGANTTFDVVASGTAPLNYQWKSIGTNISGATTSSLSLTNVQLTQAGDYYVVVTNAAGSVTSSNATLAVIQMFISDFTVNPDSTIRLTITGAAGSGYTIYSSTNLVDWAPLATLMNTNGTLQFIDSNSTNYAQRYYRVGVPP